MKTAIIDLAYLLSAVLFIFGLKRMQLPVRAVTGDCMRFSPKMKSTAESR